MPTLNSYNLVLLFFIGCFLTAASYANVQVFTDKAHPVYNTGSAQIIYLDAPSLIEDSLSEGLSSDRVKAKQQAYQRIQNPKIQQNLIQAYLDLSKAWQLGITKLPAVVVDNSYVVYGINDVAKAIQLIKEHKE